MADEVNQITAPAFDETGGQPQVEAITEFLLSAQLNHPEEYAAFRQELETNHIPWSYEDKGFLERLAALRIKIGPPPGKAGAPEAQLNIAVPKELLEPLVRELESQGAQQKEASRGFVHDLVTTYVAALKKEGVGLAVEEEKALEQKVAEKYDSLRAQAPGAPEAPQKIQQILEAGLSKKLTEEESLRAAAATKAVAAEAAPQLASVAAAEAAVGAAFASPVERKDVFLRIYNRVSEEEPTASVSRRAQEAERLTQLFQAFTAGVAGEEGATQPPDLTKTGVFFRSFAESTPQKIAASVADRALSLLPQPTRERLVAAVLSRSWEHAVDQLTQKLGQALVTTAPFQQAIEAGNKAFGVPAPSGGLRAIRNFFLDAGGAVVGTPDETMLGFMELTRLNAVLPENRKLFFGLFPSPVATRPFVVETSRRLVAESFVLRWQQFYLATVVPYVRLHPRPAPALRLDFLSDIGGWVIRLGGKKVAKKAGKEIAGAAAKTATGEAVKKGLISLLTKLGLGTAASALGAALTGGASFLVQAAVWVGGKLLGLAWAGVRALLTAPAGLLIRLMRGEGASVRWQDDLPLLFAAAPVVIIVLLFVFPWFLNFPQTQDTVRTSALVAPLGGEAAGEAAGSRFIKLTKTPSPASFPNNNPGPVTYAITIEATERPLTNMQISDVFSVVGSAGNPTVTAPAIPPQNVQPGSPYNYSFTLTLDGRFKDSVVSNTLTVVADAGDALGEKKAVTAVVLVGNPPTGCLVPAVGANDPQGYPSSAWDPAEWSRVVAAVAQLARSPRFMAQLCAGGKPIQLYRVKRDYGGGQAQGTAGNIFLYNAGVGSYASAVYTVAHEAGHVFDARTDYFTQYQSEGLYQKEGPIWTYPNQKSTHEDFAETIADYVAYKIFRSSRWPRALDYPKEYPLHYNFAKQIFGMEY